MKVDVFSLNGDELVFYPSVPNRTFSVSRFDHPVELLGTIDLPIEKPKKTVTKEAQNVIHGDDPIRPYRTETFKLPDKAKNIKCTYEIEE